MILLKQFMPISKPQNYKMHVGKRSEGVNPLDEFIKDFDNWIGWNSFRGSGKPDRFNRKYIISFIDFYPQKETFLFGGIFEVLATRSDGYDVKLCDEYKEFIGRLKVKNIKTVRGSSFRFENHYDVIEVIELLNEPYSSHVFPGYASIDFPFGTIKNVIDKEAEDWKVALLNIKGIYMLTDTLNGKRYIGSAYGTEGIWSRWKAYCDTGHGYNKDLIALVNSKGYDYVATNFKFTLLEIHSQVATDEAIILRENYWKEVMLSRNSNFGYNKN